MPVYQARSIRQMVLLGFLVVLLPVVAALIYGANSLSSMARNHRDHLVTAADAAETSQNLAKSLLDLERLARQYHLLADANLLSVFNGEVDKVLENLNSLRTLHRDNDVVHHANRLEDLVKTMRTGLNEGSSESDKVFEALQLIPQMRGSLQQLRSAIEEDLKDKVESAKRLAEVTQSRLLIIGLTVLPGTLLLVAFFSVLITRPIKTIDATIKQIGMGHYPSHVDLRGPRDLSIVAKRLTWLGQRLKDSEASQERFLRHISHELKTPLASIKEGIELLADGIPGPINPKQREVLDILQSGLLHFQKLINNLLDFNLLRGNKTLMRSPVVLSDLISNLVRMHQLPASRKGIQFELIGEPLNVAVDKSVLSAAIDNLLSNALGFSPSGGRIIVRWFRRDDDLVIVVRDEGPGIARDEREKIFLPFYQGKATRDGPLKGTGMGLSVARECINSHGGELLIVDADKGACFEIHLPQVLRQDPPGLSPKSDRSPRRWTEAQDYS
ncbi:MAG TPA: HAMP domain-containing sensor histidine kinase [Oligoflexus sp.]|uniref:sensor histidine kinase n=1 Tax=Oligoflexus sp. TaxID=1971216 RepID=UPI002D6D39FB|nr:HAMP domain-containing sensor histidine kinase [Oligoflexus sp.]HYX38760.1 HAMP domain-containing sensor histidine kinase [Oligoflexus sp.]